MQEGHAQGLQEAEHGLEVRRREIAADLSGRSLRTSWLLRDFSRFTDKTF